mmetsp:Transcript_32517/g.38892  ORF Transcript_32517/g.38892 Transcript_32517/m.38892 type:complete len:84 (-) Transcript_32517:143-394(-)
MSYRILFRVKIGVQMSGMILMITIPTATLIINLAWMTINNTSVKKKGDDIDSANMTTTEEHNISLIAEQVAIAITIEPKALAY